MKQRRWVGEAAIVVVAVALTSCGRSGAPQSAPQKGAGAVAPGGSSGKGGLAASSGDAGAFVADDLWVRSKEGDEEDLVLLGTREGASGLREALSSLEFRGTALRAAAFTDGFYALPWLSEIVSTGSEADAALAVDSALTLAARPRTAVDPEDALEIREGCDAFERLVAASEKGEKEKLPPALRGKVQRFLGMMADRAAAPRAAPRKGEGGNVPPAPPPGSR